MISKKYYLGLIDEKNTRVPIKIFDNALAPYFKNLDIKLKNNDFYWINGCCILGQRKTFIDVNGDIYPCEKLDVGDKKYMLGNVDSGYNIKKILNIIDDFKTKISQCNKCWAINYCHLCWKMLYSDVDKCQFYRKEIYARIKKAISVLEFNPKLASEFNKINIE